MPIRNHLILPALAAVTVVCGPGRTSSDTSSDTSRDPAGDAGRHGPPPASGPAQNTLAAASRVTDSVRVYKDPSCGCCKAWVQYMRDSGFAVAATDVPSQGALDSVKAANHVPSGAASCHTALVGGYVVEGHVPADLVRRMLRERPDIVGLAVPGMVTGSPGMEGPDPQHYTVVAMLRDGTTRPYAER